MTISSTTRVNGPYVSGTALPVTFKVFAAADLEVVRLNTSTGVETTLVLNSDYTVALNGNQNTNPGGTVNLTVAASATSTVTITSDIANLQPTDLTNQGGFYPEVITDALDRATIQIQQMSQDVGRSLKGPISDGSLNMELPTAAQRANSFLAFDANGVPTAVVSGSSGAPTTITRQVFSGTGSQTAFTLASDPGALGNSAQVYIGGVYQQRSTYTIAGTTLTFSQAPVAGTDNIEFVNFLTSNIGATSADLITYTPSGSGAVARTAASKFGDTVSVKDFGAVGDGVTNDTAAINAALATNKSVYFPAGTYMTTGNHVIPYSATVGRTLYGDSRTSSVLKRISGTNPILDVRQFAYCNIENLRFDGNNTGGHGLIWRAHYSYCSNLWFKDIQDYAILVSGSNVCEMERISTQNCYGGMLLSNTSDPISPQPTYTCLYSSFENLFLEWSGGPSANYSAIRLAGSQGAILTFTDVSVEPTSALTVAGLSVPCIDISTSNNSSLYFSKLTAEFRKLSNPFVRVSSTTSDNIKFVGGRGYFGASGIAGDWSSTVFDLSNVDNVTISDFLFAGPDLAGVVTAPAMITLTASKNVVIRDNIISLKEANKLVSADTASTLVSVSGNAIPPKMVGASSTDAAAVTTVSSQQLGRVVLADDSYYDIFGNGGVTNPGANFTAIITMYAVDASNPLPRSATIARFYAQTYNASGGQQTSSWHAGGDTELVALADGVAAALASTTDGKLGIQVGGGSVTARAVRLYNRLGFTAIVSLHVEYLNIS